MSEDALYTCLIESQSDDEAFVQVYWARARHLGAAIEKMLALARQNGASNPIAREADPYDIENLEGEVYPDSAAEVFHATTCYSFPPEPIFTFPAGIIPSCIEDEGADEVDGTRPGYQRSQDDAGLIEIAVNVPHPDLVPVYERLLQMHSSYATFWYQFHSHWEEAEEQFYENSDLNTPEAIFGHLQSHPHDAVQNGSVTLTAYLEEGATNLSITDHKRILIWTYSDDVAKVFEIALKSAGFSSDDDLVSVDHRMHHWHYRPSESLSRIDLADYLTTAQGFSPWSPGSTIE